MNSRFSDTLLGLIFFGALVGLGIATIALSDFRIGQQTYDVPLYSADVGYLRPGDPVLLFGMPGGKVRSLERLEQPRPIQLPNGREVECMVVIHTRLDADLYARLPVDTDFLIEDRGLLGGKLIRVRSGSSDVYIQRDAALVAFSTTSALQSAGEVIAENRDNLRRTLDGLTEMVDVAQRGGGLLGALVFREDLKESFTTGVDEARDTFANLNTVTGDIANGSGTLGKLVYGSDLYDDAKAVAADARTLASDARSFLDDGRGFVDELRETGSALRNADGTLGKLIHSDELYAQAQGVLGDISATTGDIRGSKGLLGMLLNDPEMADDVQKAVKLVLGAIEDARESTPVQSVGSFLFGTF